MATPRPAYYESAGESDDDGHAGRSKPRSQSNVAVKRSSQSSDLGRNNAAARPPDLASDSGYSSRTAATKSSADSAKSSSDRRGSPVKTEAPPAVPDAPTPTKTRSKQSESSKKKAVQARESSKSSKTTKPSKSSKNIKPVVVRQSSTRDRTTSAESQAIAIEHCNGHQLPSLYSSITSPAFLSEQGRIW
ncbi:hypothetical protein GTA08_BOTSDO12229 [Neofusicoccum parvum]|uniref:Uncharacterized protein n=1 Tax=Neofusicoccum parvum TaxID=310453 RepID=A0ACB5SJ09_9PEZI|nr:hypothetical protein GTA08_BOTSDO12229 [Neofusicoccum parvum]GME64144.1 hypothetical protein GTA08_BOTSDO12229 [Neofusicoccum parvum]